MAKFIDRGWAPEDDPMFSEGLKLSWPRKPDKSSESTNLKRRSKEGEGYAHTIFDDGPPRARKRSEDSH